MAFGRINVYFSLGNTDLTATSGKLSNIAGIIPITQSTSLQLSIANAFSGKATGNYLLVGIASYSFVFGYGNRDNANNTAVGMVFESSMYQGTSVGAVYTFGESLTNMTVHQIV